MISMSSAPPWHLAWYVVVIVVVVVVVVVFSFVFAERVDLLGYLSVCLCACSSLCLSVSLSVFVCLCAYLCFPSHCVRGSRFEVYFATHACHMD